MAQGSEEPPFLRVGTEVSAKYRGAFCEASIKTVKKHVKCKIQYKDNSTATLTDDVVKGDLKIGSDVVVKTLDGRLMDGVIIKLTDASTYTVVFDDGDERTLRRTSLCLKGGRHFNESETLDHLPLTDPENFGTPVIQNGKKRKKRRPRAQQSSFEDGDSEKEEGSPIPTKKKCSYNDSILGKVIIVDRGARRKSHWFPALGVSPSQENLMYIKSNDQCLARSFKDGN
ncbi:AT-rich interactive domain-containing protein 4A [Exaiptasia diaphana]|uniref:Tudor domain-containing protein n=1 Tax=Exaiptasia diaphana TaxID=2652724 RepID=A0A913WQM1_EXADI|nr:AT-rich interactive domain-containing protein 4A [Exaiptasia diaphana]